MKLLKETTVWDVKIPNHTYAFEGGNCVGYIKAGTSELAIFKKPMKQFDKRYRTFVEVK